MKSFNLTYPYIALFLVVLFLFTSCEKDKYNALDVSVTPPYLFNGKLDKYLVDTDTISVNGQFSVYDTITVTNRIRVQVSDLDGLPDVKSIKYFLIAQNYLSIVASGYLYDNGSTGDSIVGDGVYTSDVSFKIPRVLVGLFSFKVMAEDRYELFSNELHLGFNIKRLNVPPVISDLSAPDTVILSDQVTTILLRVNATDPNGLRDIQRVFFNSFKPDGTPSSGNPFRMYDDGSESIIFPPSGRSGDEIKGDGIFSLQISLLPTNLLGSYRFEFQAKDFKESASNIIVHTITVVRP